MEIIRGRVWKYGDNINTDVIFPGKYTYTISEPTEMPAHALEDLDPEFANGVKPGDIIIAGNNWGCGSSREQAVTCLKEGGLGAIIAESFARIYYRNCLNAALPALICPDAVNTIQNGEQIEIDLDKGEIHTLKGNYSISSFPEVVREIFDSGGLIAYTKKRLEESQ